MITKTLTQQQILTAINSIKNGRMVRVGYKKEIPLRASYKTSYKVEKYAETTIRLGVDYNHIGSVVARRTQISTLDQTQTTPWAHWRIQNKVLENNKNGTLYLSATTVKKSNTKVMYKVTTPEGAQTFTASEMPWEKFSQMMLAQKQSSAKEVFDIKFENIFRIGNVGERL